MAAGEWCCIVWQGAIIRNTVSDACRWVLQSLRVRESFKVVINDRSEQPKPLASKQNAHERTATTLNAWFNHNISSHCCSETWVNVLNASTGITSFARGLWLMCSMPQHVLQVSLRALNWTYFTQFTTFQYIKPTYIHHRYIWSSLTDLETWSNTFKYCLGLQLDNVEINISNIAAHFFQMRKLKWK